MKFVFYLSLLCLLSNVVIAQQTIEGIVFDKQNKQRLNRVEITNLRTKEFVYNNTKGEFFIKAQKGDVLLSKLQGYKNDTLVVSNQSTVIIYLEKNSIALPEVIFKDSVKLARERYEETKKAFNQAVRIGNNKDLIGINGFGVGLSIDALWSAFSKEGNNARRLMEIMERDYQNNFVDQVFNKSLVTRTTGLRGDKLLLFMLNYRPSYNFAVKANEYVMVSYIKQAYKLFSMSKNPVDISSLKPISIP